MERIKIAHMADLHINSPFSSLSAEKVRIRKNELIAAFDAGLEAAAHADIIAAAGDIFDNAGDKRVIEYVMSAFAGCGKRVFIAAGNHDPLDEIYSKTKKYDNIHIFGPKLECVSFDGINIYGASFETMRCPDPLLISAPDTDGINVLVMHGVVGRGEYNPMDEDYLSRFDYCALGHVHEYRTQRTAGGMWVYSGFCEPRGFDEQGRGGIVIADVQKGTVKLERKELSKREYVQDTIDASECKDNMDIADIIQERLSPDDLYSFKITGVSGFVPSPDYIKRCLDIFCFDISIDISMEIVRSETDTADGEDITLRGRFIAELMRLAENASEGDRKKYMRALDIGLSAFEKVGDST